MCKRIVITGYGVVKPSNATDEKNGNLFHICGEINEQEVVNKRLRKKIDNFCINGLLAADEAIKMSGLEIASLDPYDIGISVGNCLGGWRYIEKEVRQLHKVGIHAVSPYLATAWFPAALQGQISLKYGIKGFSKTYSMSDVAGMQAIGGAIDAIQRGKCSTMITGASEDLSSEFVQNVLRRSYKETMSKCLGGSSLTEFFADGSVFFVLEDYELALKRGAKVLCELSDYIDVSMQSVNKISDFYLQNFKGSNHTIGYKDGLFKNEDILLQQFCPSNEMEFFTTKCNEGNQFSVSGPMDIVHAIIKMMKNSELKCAIIQRINYMGRFNIIAINNL